MTGRRFEDMVTIGRILRPQGRRGEVLVQVLSDRPDRFPSLRTAFVPDPDGGARELAVTGGWPHKGRFVLSIAGVDSIEAAQALRGAELRIDETELADLPPGSFYHHQLRGLRVQDEAGHALGTVVEVLEAGSAPVLVVRGDEEILVPLVDEFVPSVDVAAGRLVVRVPEAVEC